MATIMDGTQYALTSPIEKKHNHSVVFVKLTDSALKAIEDYALAISKGNVSNSVKPLIELRPNSSSQGIITIPNKLNDNKDDNNKAKPCYNFSVKDIQNDGILECVKQTNSNMSMESLGKIMLRMQIHANDDVYQKTKDKMVVAEQELKKYNTKVINSSDVGRKGKAKRPFNLKFSSHHNSCNTANGNSTSSSTNSSNSSTFLNKQTNNLSRFTKYSSTTNGNQQAKTSYNSSNFHAVSQSENIKKVLLQLLSVKGYKLVDLMPKIQERSKEPIDTKLLMNILNSIATLKDGTYHLNESVSEEIQPDVKDDKEINQKLQRNSLIDFQTSATTSTSKFSNNNGSLSNGNNNSPFSDTSVRSLSSPNSLIASPSNKSSSPYPKNKRNQEFAHCANNSKKFKSDNSRLQAHKSHNSNSAIVYSPYEKVNTNSEHDSPDSRIKNSNSNYHNSYKSSAAYFNDTFNSINKRSSDKESGSQLNHPIHSNYGNGSGSMNSSPNSSPDSGISHIGNVLGSDSSNNNESEDYYNKYKKIQDVNQLAQYKSDFNAEFPEYKKLYEYVEGVSRQFEELKEMIQAKEEESDEWQELIKQIFEKYDEVKTRSKFQKAQKRLNYLHHKLLHIKNMINEYYMYHNNISHHDKSIGPPFSKTNSQLKS